MYIYTSAPTRVSREVAFRYCAMRFGVKAGFVVLLGHGCMNIKSAFGLVDVPLLGVPGKILYRPSTDIRVCSSL